MKLSKKFCVYVDKTTIGEDAGTIYYVGKGQQSRILRKSRGYAPRNSKSSKHDNIMNKYGLDRQIVFETDNEDDAFEKEKELISLYKLNIYKYPENKWACCFCDGGNGRSGIRWSKAGIRHTLENNKNYQNDDFFTQMIPDRINGMSFSALSSKYNVARETIRYRLLRLMSKEDIAMTDIAIRNKPRYNKIDDNVFTLIMNDIRTLDISFQELSVKYSISIEIIYIKMKKLMPDYEDYLKNSKCSDDIFDQITKDRMSGISVRDLSDKYGVDAAVIYGKLSKLSKDNFSKPDDRTKYSKELMDKIAADRKSMSFAKLAKKYHLNPKTIVAWFKLL